MNGWQLKPIGFFRGSAKSKKDVARQGALSSQAGFVRLEPWVNPSQSLTKIEGFSHLWLVFGFHESQKTRSMVRPPKRPDLKVGVFASRAPYRPNHLGLSLVKFERRENHRLHLSQCDLLDLTPIFDIKPYLPEFEAVPNATAGWTAENLEGPYQIEWAESVVEPLKFLSAHLKTDLDEYCRVQLTYFPYPTPSKRIESLGENRYCLAHGEWRIFYEILSTNDPYKLKVSLISPALVFSDQDFLELYFQTFAHNRF